MPGFVAIVQFFGTAPIHAGLLLGLAWPWQRPEPAAVEVIPAGRAPFTAELESIDQQQAVFKTAEGLEPVALADLRTVRFTSPLAADQPDQPFRLTLIDGTQIHVSGLTGDSRQLRAQTGSQAIRLATTAALSAQLRELNESQTKTWQAICQSVVSSDVLVVHQASGVLTKIEGIIEGIADGKVQFQYSGRTLEVPFSKLAGLRFFSKQTADREQLRAVVRDVYENEWMTSGLRTDSNRQLQLQLQCGEDVALDLRELASIDFSLGSLRYVADMQPIERRSQQIFDFPVELPTRELFGAQRVPAPSRPGKISGPSLKFLGGGQATYRIPDEFTRLEGSVELRPQGDKYTPVRVQIQLEGKSLFDQRLTATGKATTFEFPVAADQRLRLMVTPEARVPTGDVVLWRELRLLK